MEKSRKIGNLTGCQVSTTPLHAHLVKSELFEQYGSIRGLQTIPDLQTTAGFLFTSQHRRDGYLSEMHDPGTDKKKPSLLQRKKQENQKHRRANQQARAPLDKPNGQQAGSNGYAGPPSKEKRFLRSKI